MQLLPQLVSEDKGIHLWVNIKGGLDFNHSARCTAEFKELFYNCAGEKGGVVTHSVTCLAYNNSRKTQGQYRNATFYLLRLQKKTEVAKEFQQYDSLFTLSIIFIHLGRSSKVSCFVIS